MKRSTPLVSEIRKYGVLTTADARTIAAEKLKEWGFPVEVFSFGLPEIDDRYHVWRVPILDAPRTSRTGEIVINARTAIVDLKRSTDPDTIRDRMAAEAVDVEPITQRTSVVVTPKLRNTIVCGDSEFTLPDLPAESIDLVFTSPPYFNARPDYSDFVAYEDYLLKMRKVIQQVHRLLSEGRFFVMNTAPVLLRRASRSGSSRRLAVPFDLHRIFTEEGFDFIDDIIWVKPEGAGWATGRGRRFAADRNPLQYKAVPVTEYVIVYRKHSERLIDWHIRNHADREAVKDSRITGEYEKTNIWRLPPAHNRNHPAVFPVALAERVIRYYSFKNDVVLDPFAGVGTVGEAAVKLGRRFVLGEMIPEYVDILRSSAVRWLGKRADDVLCVGCSSLDSSSELL
jgi:DNA modification methylase